RVRAIEQAQRAAGLSALRDGVGPQGKRPGGVVAVAEAGEASVGVAQVPGRAAGVAAGTGDAAEALVGEVDAALVADGGRARTGAGLPVARRARGGSSRGRCRLAQARAGRRVARTR